MSSIFMFVSQWCHKHENKKAFLTFSVQAFVSLCSFLAAYFDYTRHRLLTQKDILKKDFTFVEGFLSLLLPLLGSNQGPSD